MLYRNGGKRLLDLIVAAAVGLLCSPLMLLVAVVIRWQLGPPILFRQPRAGKQGHPFTLYKFRTMREATDADGNPLPDEARMTRCGQWIRSLSLDELPQLWNILRGDMSVIGPRPLLVRYLPRYSPEQARRHEVRPGITGWAQVNGRNTLSWEQKFELDVWYVDHLSFLLDLRILMRTLGCVLLRQGISAEDHVSMTEFLGSSCENAIDEIRQNA
jgi:lipopolysaccharide/colanic/teichoic acid biosynthesis glycosyltransferase